MSVRGELWSVVAALLSVWAIVIALALAALT